VHRGKYSFSIQFCLSINSKCASIVSNSNDGELECWKIDFITFEYVRGIPCKHRIQFCLPINSRDANIMSNSNDCELEC
jgi:hypothetical protein